MGRLVHGVGINDAGYTVEKRERLSGRRKVIWACPYYVKWKNMLLRCYSKNIKRKDQTILVVLYVKSG